MAASPTWPLAPGAVLTGSFQAQVSGYALGATVLQPVQAQALGLSAPASAWAVTHVGAPPPNQAWITPDGGRLHAQLQPLTLLVPRGALTQPVQLELAPPTATVPLSESIVAHFALRAHDPAGQPVTTFAHSLTLLADLDDYPAVSALPGTPTFFWFNDQTGAWEVVESEVTWGAHTLVAHLDHFSTFGIGASTEETSYGAQFLPSVRGFTTDEWSGNSSIHYPLRLPPGPGGLGLNLSLDYSSEVVNSLRAGGALYDHDGDPETPDFHADEDRATHLYSQASILGLGWSLGGLGQIVDDLHGGPTRLLFAGGNLELTGAQSEPQRFLRIQRMERGSAARQNGWYIWTPDGTQYTFGAAEGDSNEGYAWVVNRGPADDCYTILREAHLMQIADPHGNRIVIDYASQEGYLPQGFCASGAGTYIRALHPTEIRYLPAGASDPAGATVRLLFEYTPRQDIYLEGRVDQFLQLFYDLERLTAITIQLHDAAGFTTVRSYDLAHSYVQNENACGCNPDLEQRLLLLTHITETGRLGGSLPAWQFSYATDTPGWWIHQLLKTADNGQGGSTHYSYGTEGAVVIQSREEGTFVHQCGITRRYRVQEQRVEDGLGNWTQSAYSTSQALALAWSVWDEFGACQENYEFGGYRALTRTLSDASGAQQVGESHYHQGVPIVNEPGNYLPDPRKGQRWLRRTLDPATSAEGQATYRAWGSYNDSSTHGTNWVRLDSEVLTTTHHAATGAIAISRRTDYGYDAAWQNGLQYGNRTHLFEYRHGESSPYRTQEIHYYPNDTQDGAGNQLTYLVNLPARHRLLDSSAVCQGETRFLYDPTRAIKRRP